MKRVFAGLAFLILFAGLAQAQCNPTIADYVKTSGHKFEADPKCTFWISSDALTIPHDDMQGTLIIAERGDVVMVVAVIRLKAQLDLSSAKLEKLLHMNNELQFLKVGIDPDGDLFLRSELQKRAMDSAMLKDAVDRVKGGSQKVFDATK